MFELVGLFKPAGDQPQAIAKLTEGLLSGAKHQVLLGVTGSGKTFTIANVIARVQRPTLVISHNKTLAAQLYAEFKGFFPRNAVEYFVSYFDYYQPEAYIPRTDTYIEKDSSINEEIERLRLSTMSSLTPALSHPMGEGGAPAPGEGGKRVVPRLRHRAQGGLRGDGHSHSGGPGNDARAVAGETGGDAIQPQRHRLRARLIPLGGNNGANLFRARRSFESIELDVQAKTGSPVSRAAGVLSSKCAGPAAGSKGYFKPRIV